MDDDALIAARDEVLRKVGRNVVNFARMEAMLKFLNAQKGFNGSIRELRQTYENAKDEVSRHTMGLLVEEFLRTVYASAGISEGEASNDFSLTFSFRIEDHPDLAIVSKRGLRAIVEERNKLIHQWLAVLDTNSIESCEALGTALDKQNATVEPQYETLRMLVTSLQEFKREALRTLESEWRSQ